MRVLVFQTAFLGDLILTSPLLKSLKKSLPEAKVDLVVRKGLEEVFRGAPFVDQIIPFDKKGVFKFARRLKERNYELVLSPHRSHRTALILFLAGIKERIGYDTAGFSFLYTQRVKYRMGKGVHEIDRLLDLLKPLKGRFNLEIDGEPELPTSPKEVEEAKEKFNLKGPYAVIAPGSAWPTKAWVPEGFAEVARFLKGVGLEAVLVGSKGDESYCSACQRLFPQVVNLCGKTTIRELFAVIKGAEVVVSNDSAPVHAAVSLKTPVVEVYGPTVPDFGFFPYRNGKWVELQGLSCRPCGIHGGKRCPEGHFKCMRELPPEKVIEAVKELLKI